MDGGPPKDTPQAPQPTTELTPTDKLRAEFEMLPPAQRRELARSLFYSAYELPQGWTDWLDNQIVNPAKEAFGDNKSTEPTTTTSPQKETTALESDLELENELAKSVKNIAFYGKFPKGLVVNGNQIARPEDLGRGNQVYSPDRWGFRSNRAIALSGWFGNRPETASTSNDAIPNTAFVTEEPVPNDPDSTVITFNFKLDNSVRDNGGRLVANSFISLNLPNDQARTLLRKIKERPDGADFAERFLQKTIPGALDGDLDSPGIKREELTGLVVLDQEALSGFFTSPEQITSHSSLDRISERQFQDYVRQNLERKPYSMPVGVSPDQPAST